MIPLAIGEGWTAVFGGLIPILGLAAIGILIYKAVRPPEEDDDEEQQPPPT